MLSLYMTVSPRRLQYRWQCHSSATCCCKFVFFVEVLIRTSQNNRPRLTRRSIPQLFEEDCPHLDSPGDNHVITTQCQAQRRAVACFMLHTFAIHTLYKSKKKQKKLPEHILLHELVSVDVPGQETPLLDGSGLLQTRVLCRVPSPHVTEHSPRADQELQPPLTGWREPYRVEVMFELMPHCIRGGGGGGGGGAGGRGRHRTLSQS